MKSKLVVLGKRIREARLRAKLSQVDVAKRIGKSKQLASAWEAGRAEMTATTLGDFARIVSADANWLLLGMQNGSNGAAPTTLPQGNAMPLLSEAETVKYARGKLELSAAPNQIYSSFQTGPCAFALTVTDMAMAPSFTPGDVVVIDPDTAITPGTIVAAVVKEVDVELEVPMLVLRHIHFRSPILGTPPFELVPASPAWPSLLIRRRGHAHLLGAVAMDFRRTGSRWRVGHS